MNRNKRSVVIDLKTLDGKAAMRELIKTADVLVESFRPGVLDRLGFGYDTLADGNPGLVLCQISGWGQDGPMAGVSGHDVNYLAAMGLLSYTGGVDEVPRLSNVQVADGSGGLFAALSILAALRERDRSGRGQRIDVSLAHAALMFAPMTVAGAIGAGTVGPASEGIWSGGAICYQIYRCEDGWVALGALEEKFWANWCRGVGRPDLLESGYDAPGSWAHGEIVDVIGARTREEWAEFAQEHDCCLTVVSGLIDAMDSPLVRGREMVRTLRHGGTEYEGLGSPVIMSRTPPDVTRRPAPSLGAHSQELLGGRVTK